MTSVEMNIGIYETFKKPNDSTPTPTPTTPPISISEASLSKLLTSNVVDDVTLLQPTDFVKEKKPLRVYVSSLLRTWETALLLFLRFLNNTTATATATDTTYTPVLVLVVSPFLREVEKSTLGIKGINASNESGDVANNIKQFLKFIDLYILLSNIGDSTKIPEHNEIQKPFSDDPKKFNIVVEFSPNQKLYIHVDATTSAYIVFKYDLSETGVDDTKKKEIEGYVNNKVSLSKDNIDYIVRTKSVCHNTYMVYNPYINLEPIPYKKYNNAIDKNTQINLPYALTPMDKSNFSDFDSFSLYFPDIFNYLKWVITIRKHPKNIPIFVVSHSKTMQDFLKKIFFCFSNSNLTPSNTFIEMYEYSIKTNLWSIRLKYMGYSVIIFRHGFTCDNMFHHGDLTIVRTQRLNGYYSHLSMWGIYSVKLFCKENYTILSDITDIKDNILSIRFGFQKQPKIEITRESIPNEITCGGDIEGRFNNKNPKDIMLNFTPTNSTNLKKSMQLVPVKSSLDSDIDSDIDKDISSLISIEFTTCPSKSLIGSTFGCLKLSCLYNQRYVIIFPYIDKSSGNNYTYEISFYDTSISSKKSISTKKVAVVNELQNMLEYENVLLWLFNYEEDKSVMSNFKISSVINILMEKGIENIVDMLKTFAEIDKKKIDVNTDIYLGNPAIS